MHTTLSVHLDGGMLTSVSTCVRGRYEVLSVAPGHNLPLPFPFLLPQGELDPYGLSSLAVIGLVWRA